GARERVDAEGLHFVLLAAKGDERALGARGGVHADLNVLQARIFEIPNHLPTHRARGADDRDFHSSPPTLFMKRELFGRIFGHDAETVEDAARVAAALDLAGMLGMMIGGLH